jgi:hypothetical protein
MRRTLLALQFSLTVTGIAHGLATSYIMCRLLFVTNEMHSSNLWNSQQCIKKPTLLDHFRHHMSLQLIDHQLLDLLCVLQLMLHGRFKCSARAANLVAGVSD